MEKRILRSDRLRTLPRQWSWVDQRLLRMGNTGECDAKAWALYLFLVTVSDRNGLSYYSDQSICEWLNFHEEELITAGNALIRADLLARQGAIYQLLSLPAEKAYFASSKPRNSGQNNMMSIQEIIRTLGGER